MLTLSDQALEAARRAAEVGATDHPLDPEVVTAMLNKLGDAKAGEGFHLTLEELRALDACFQVGGEGEVTDALWTEVRDAITAAITAAMSSSYVGQNR